MIFCTKLLLQVPNVAPILGELAFFIGIPQPAAVKARPDGDIHLLILSKEDGDELIHNYPEQVIIILANLLDILTENY